MMKRNGGRQLRSWLLLFLWAATCAAGCASSRGAMIPPCPKWSEEEIQELEFVQVTGCCPHLENAIGRQVLHCEAIQELID